MIGRTALIAAAFVISVGAVAIPRASWCGVSSSGALSIEATLEPDHVAPGEEATLTVQIRSAGLNLPDVGVPPLPGVAVQRAGTAQNFSMVQGRVERTSTTVYRLTPRTEGVVTIPPLRVSVGRDHAETAPLTLTVSRASASRGSASSGTAPRPLRGGSRAPAGAPEVFVKATVDRPRVYWNQQIVLSLKLYSRVDIIGDVDWKAPSTTGFWTEGLGPPRQRRVTMNGVEYAMMEIPTALFPTRTGTLTIGPAQMRFRVARVIQPPDPWSMLAIPEVVPQDMSLTSDPITITVDPLPPRAPAGFQGAVGDFSLALHVDGPTARAGEPILARATIRGTGNVSTIRDPEIRAAGAARQYVAGTSTRIDRSGDRLIGERETDIAFVADDPGAVVILPVRFAWFDPEARRYRSQSSDSAKVQVLPGNLTESRTGRPSPGAPMPAAPRRARGPFGRLTLDPPGGSTTLVGFSVLAYAAAVASARARRRLHRDPRFVRMQSLDSLIARDLARANALVAQKQPARAAVLAENALRAGAGYRFDVDVAGLPRAEMFGRLRARGAQESEIAALESLFESLEGIAYAPPETRSADAKQAIRAVSDALGRYRRVFAR
ncbi:MAG TPA: BatD family protein [Candidatus Eisenbacteria bacterium]